MKRSRLIIASAAVFLVLFVAYAATATISNGSPTKHVSILAGVRPDGSMFYACDVANSTGGTCEDVSGHATVHATKRDRLRITVRSDDGRAHSHDFRLEGLPYLVWPAGIEMELDDGPETKTLTTYAKGEYRFICELKGHEAAGMWGTLLVA